MKPGQLSPQKEQEIALKILERAELAQMTRQLKVGLSKVATPKKSSRDNSKGSVKLSPSKFEIPHVALEAERISPLKRTRNFKNDAIGEDSGNALEDGESPLKTQKRPSTPPRAQPALRRKSFKTDRDDVPELLVPRTPKSSRDNNDVGADLLMYLATSPYTSTKSGHGPQTPSTNTGVANIRIPTTPSHPSQNSNGDLVRLSHMKGQNASPNFGFKVPNHTAANSTHQDTPSHANTSYSEIMDSPAVAFYMSSPRKHKANAKETLAIPGTPSRELRTAQLLRTPNFNMGDYVHNLFSPSPRVTSSGSARDSKKD